MTICTAMDVLDNALCRDGTLRRHAIGTLEAFFVNLVAWAVNTSYSASMPLPAWRSPNVYLSTREDRRRTVPVCQGPEHTVTAAVAPFVSHGTTLCHASTKGQP